MAGRDSHRMKHLSRLLLVLLVLLCAGCATYAPAPLDSWLAPERIYTQEQGGVSVATAILQDDEAERLYGVDLADAGLQAIWLRVVNRSTHGYWLLVSALDASYFSPDEAAILFHWRLSGADEARATERFRQLSVPLKTGAGEVSEGFVLAPRHEGGRYLPVLLLGENSVLDFGFSVPLPDGDFDYEKFQPERIYPESEREDIGLAQLRERLKAMNCCTGNEAGDRQGDPLNVVFIGSSKDVAAALVRSGWSYTHRIDGDTVQRLIGAAISGAEYAVAPVSPLYLFGRPQDLAMQRARSNILQRNHIRLWMTPMRYAGKPVWLGQVSRDITIKLTTLSPTLTTHVIDPNVDESREALLQSLLVSGAVRRFGFVGGAPLSTPANPHRNLTEDPYFSDGLRLVAEVSADENTSLDEVEFLPWRESEDPIGRVQNAARQR